MDSYSLGIFANLYPSSSADSRGSFIRRMVEKLEYKGVRVKKAVKSTPSLTGYFPFYVNSIPLSCDYEVDLLQAHYIPHSSIIPALLKGKKPLVLKFHGDDGRIYPFQNPLNMAITRFMLRRANHIITVSQEIKGRLVDLGANPDLISPISSGIDTLRFHQFSQKRARNLFHFSESSEIVLFLGRLHPWKGITEILEAARQHPDLEFVLAGPGNIPPHPKNCIFLGEVPPEKIPSLINAADISILPSYTEGISNFIMESLACQVPVIATNVGGNPELIREGETGMLVKPKDSRQLSDAILYLKNNPEIRKSMGRKGREYIDANHDEEILIEKMMRIHRDLL